MVIVGGSSQESCALNDIYNLNIQTWKMTKVHTYKYAGVKYSYWLLLRKYDASLVI